MTLKNKRESKKISIKEMAERLNISVEEYQEIENKANYMTESQANQLPLLTLLRIAEILEISCNDIYDYIKIDDHHQQQ